MASISILTFNSGLVGFVSRNQRNVAVCPILHDEILEGSTVYRMECCKKIFSDAIIEWIKITNRCPNCSSIVNIYSVLPYKELLIVYLKVTLSNVNLTTVATCVAICVAKFFFDVDLIFIVHLLP